MHRQTDRSFAALTTQLLARIATLPGKAILDIGCGAGELSLALSRARRDARIVGLDISADLLAAARSRSSHHANLEFILADAATWQPDGFSPDLLVSRHGVMFFDEPVKAFAHLRGIAAPGARLAFSCFRTPRENPWMAQLAALLPAEDGAPPPDPDAPGPFAFADPQRVEAILAGSGWTGVDMAPVDYAYVAGAGADPVADALAFFLRIGPAARRFREIGEANREPLLAMIREWLEANRDGDLIAFPAAAWLVTASSG